MLFHYFLCVLMLVPVGAQSDDAATDPADDTQPNPDAVDPVADDNPDDISQSQVEGCERNGRCECAFPSSWSLQTQFRELESARLTLREMQGRLSTFSYERMRIQLHDVTARITSLETNINTQSFEVSTGELRDLKKNIDVIQGLLAHLNSTDSTTELSNLKIELDQLVEHVDELWTKNPYGSKADTDKELASLRERLQGCTEGFSGIGSYFPSDSEPVTDALDKAWCDSHELESVQDAITHRYSTRPYGTWLKDPLPGSPANRSHIIIKDSLVDFHMYHNYTDFIGDRNAINTQAGKKANSRYSNSEYGAVVYNGSIYFSYAGYLYRFNRTRDIYRVRSTFKRVHYSGNVGFADIDLKVDEFGLYAIGADPSNDMLLIHRIDPETLLPISTYVTSQQKSKTCQTFMVCGRLYALSTCKVRVPAAEGTTYWQYMYDTQTQANPKDSHVELFVSSKYGHLVSLNYNPREKMLMGWDKGHLVTYKINWSRIMDDNPSRDEESSPVEFAA